MKTKFLLSMLIAALAITSSSTCKVSKSNMPEPEENIDSPQIIFLNYSIYKQSNQKNIIRLANKIIANGKLKGNTSPEPAFTNGDLKCIQLSKNSVPIDSIYLSNPLFQTVEYADEYGQFSKKTIALDSAQFSIRMQLNPKTAAIAIKQIDTEDHNKTPLIITKIK